MSKRISRRTVLRGLGTALALPLLEAMAPVSAKAAAEATAAPKRLVFCYVPNGMHMPDWKPEKVGADFELPATLKPLEKHRRQLTVLSGLALDGAKPHGDGGGDHARSVAAFLTGAHPKKTDGANIRNGISVDQYAAEQIGSATRFPSLELGCEQSAMAGNCDSGYSCAYSSNISWRTPTTPVAKEINPKAVFDRLFGAAQATEAAAARQRREKYKKSVLDFVQEDAASLRRQLGSGDQRKVDEYLFAVREVERRITGGEKVNYKEVKTPDYARPEGVPKEFADHLHSMFDLMTLALQTDSTRIISFMYTNDSSNRNYPMLDVRDGHHDLSHHGGNKDKQAKIAKINLYHMQQFAYFADKLSQVREGEGTLLDNTVVLYGSGIGDGDRHNHNDLPIILLGRGGGAVSPGRHLKFASDTPLTNLYVSLLQTMGVRSEKFGDSTGPLKELAG